MDRQAAKSDVKLKRIAAALLIASNKFIQIT